jgi:hypothetical protein
MAQLRNIDRYNIASLFASFGQDFAFAKPICDETIDDTDPNDIKKFNYNNVNIAGLPPIQMWLNIITAAEEQQLLLIMIDAVRKKNPGNAPINSIYDEVKNGFEKRVLKIATAIKKKECVLFIGPELLQCKNGARVDSFNRLLALQLASKLQNAGVYFDEQFLDERFKDSLSYMANRYEAMRNATNRDVGTMAVKFFNTATVYKTAYEQIAQLSIPLIISTNPDDILEKEYAELGIETVSGYYDRSNQVKDNTRYDGSKTIIYKIFGSFQSPFSILFTDNDRVQFSKNVVKNDPPIPPEIKVLLENKYCLFLGFNFQEWHLKILIDCLGLTKASQEEKIFALLMEKANESSIEHFEKNYRFYFINDQIEEFLDDVIKATKVIP